MATFTDLRTANLNASSTANFNNIFAYGSATTTGTLNINGYASTTNIVFNPNGTNLSGFDDLYNNNGNLFFNTTQLTGSTGLNPWQYTFDGVLTPTSTTAGLFINASSTFNSGLRITNIGAYGLYVTGGVADSSTGIFASNAGDGGIAINGNSTGPSGTGVFAYSSGTNGIALQAQCVGTNCRAIQTIGSALIQGSATTSAYLGIGTINSSNAGYDNGDLNVGDDLVIDDELFGSLARLTTLNATTTNVGTLAVYSGSTFNGLTNITDLRVTSLNASTTANVNNLFVYGSATTTGTLNVNGYASTTNVVFGPNGSNIAGLDDLYVSGGNLYFNATQLNGGGSGVNEWAYTFDGVLTPTSTTAGLFINASSTFNGKLTVNDSMTINNTLSAKDLLDVSTDANGNSVQINTEDGALASVVASIDYGNTMGYLAASTTNDEYFGAIGVASSGTSTPFKNYGLYGIASGSGAGINYGLYAMAFGGGENWAAWFGSTSTPGTGNVFINDVLAVNTTTPYANAQLAVSGDSIFAGNVTSTISIAAPQFCLNNDCRTSWPSGSGVNEWAYTFDGVLTPTSTNAGLFVNASSTFNNSLRVRNGIITDGIYVSTTTLGQIAYIGASEGATAVFVKQDTGSFAEGAVAIDLSGATVGLFGTAATSTGQSIGVYGLVSTSTPEASIGVMGNNTEYSSVGYLGIHGFGGLLPNSDRINIGVAGSASLTTTTIANIGVYGEASSGIYNYAGYFRGNVFINNNLSIGTTTNAYPLIVQDNASSTASTSIAFTSREFLGGAVRGPILEGMASNGVNGLGVVRDFSIFGGQDFFPSLQFNAIDLAQNANIGYVTSTDILSFNQALGGYTFNTAADSNTSVTIDELDMSGGAIPNLKVPTLFGNTVNSSLGALKLVGINNELLILEDGSLDQGPSIAFTAADFGDTGIAASINYVTSTNRFLIQGIEAVDFNAPLLIATTAPSVVFTEDGGGMAVLPMLSQVTNSHS